MRRPVHTHHVRLWKRILSFCPPSNMFCTEREKKAPFDMQVYGAWLGTYWVFCVSGWDCTRRKDFAASTARFGEVPASCLRTGSTELALTRLNLAVSLLTRDFGERWSNGRLPEGGGSCKLLCLHGLLFETGPECGSGTDKRLSFAGLWSTRLWMAAWISRCWNSFFSNPLCVHPSTIFCIGEVSQTAEPES